MPTESLILCFPDNSVADGNRFAGSLANALQDISPDIAVERIRERADTQDFGASLGIILGTAAATAVAKGIGAWLARNSGAKVEIRRGGEVVLVATHLDSRDAAKIVQAISSGE